MTLRLATVVVLMMFGLAPSMAQAHHCDFAIIEEAFGHRCFVPGGGGGGGGVGAVDYDAMGPVFDVTMTTVDGVDCWMIAVGGNMTWDEATDRLDMFDGGGAPEWDACDFEAVDLTPDLWIEGLCPPPKPAPLVVAPNGEALTGLRAFLEIQGPQTVDIPCGDGVISATARYVVHWGDRSAPFKTTSRGGPYPDGDLTHVYQSVGGPTITVDAHWTGTVAGTTLPELPEPTSSSLTIDVDEVQAVVNH